MGPAIGPLACIEPSSLQYEQRTAAWKEDLQAVDSAFLALVLVPVPGLIMSCKAFSKFNLILKYIRNSCPPLSFLYLPLTIKLRVTRGSSASATLEGHRFDEQY